MTTQTSSDSRVGYWSGLARSPFGCDLEDFRANESAVGGNPSGSINIFKVIIHKRIDDGVADACVCVGEEPVAAGGTGQQVRASIVVGGPVIELHIAIEAAAGAKVLDAFLELGIAARPLGHEGKEGGAVGVEARRAGNE